MIDLIKRHREGLLYIIFGCGTTLVNWLAYSVCVEAFNLGVTVSNAIACFVSIVFAFITNKLLVFQSKCHDIKTLIREASAFLASRAVTGIIDIFAPAVLIGLGVNGTIFGIEGFVAKLISSAIVIILNYVLSKVIVFRNK